MRPTRDLLRRAVEAAGITILLAAGIAFCLSSGPILLEPPATMLSHADRAMRAQEPFLLYLRDLDRRLPPGATLAVLSPQSAADLIGPSYLLPLGQLPRQVVVPPALLRDPSALPPRYVAAYQSAFHDARYRLVSSTADGQLWELASPATPREGSR